MAVIYKDYVRYVKRTDLERNVANARRRAKNKERKSWKKNKVEDRVMKR
jgi:predicted double-glycine peptidase